MTNIFKVLAKVALLIGLAVAPAYAQNTITVTTVENTIGASAVDASSFVRYRLRNFSGFVPQVSGVSIISQTQIDTPVIAGATSQVIYKNSVISPASTFYTIEHWTGGKMTSSANYLCSASGDISVACSLVLVPPVPSLPIDLNYARLNGSNTPFTGNIKFSSALDLNNSGATGTPAVGAIRLSRDSTTGFLSCINSSAKSCIPFSGVSCVLVGDGITDDAPALQACINSNAGRRIFLPKVAASPSAVDYFLGSAITLSGNGMSFEGESGGYIGGTTLKWPAGTKGIIVNNATCQGCTVKNFNLVGSSPFTGASKNQCVIPSTMEGAAGGVTGPSTDDGVQVGADFTRLENLYITQWGRHGVYFTGGDVGGTFADNTVIKMVIAYGNRGDGFYGHGGDFNAGQFDEAIAYYNQFWGVHDSGFLGNTWMSPQVTGNHQDSAGGAGSTTAVNIARSSSVVTVSNFTTHGLVVGNAIVISGASDATYNGTWFVATVPDANTVTFTNGAGTTSGVTANARISTCTEAWTASTLDGGAYKIIGPSQSGSLIGAYSESGQPPSKIAGNNTTFGGIFGAGFDTTKTNYHYGSNKFFGPNYLFGTLNTGSPNFDFYLYDVAGNNTTVRFYDGDPNGAGTQMYTWNSAVAGFALQDVRTNGAGIHLFNGGIAQIDAPSEIRLNSFNCGNGVKFMNGSGVSNYTIDCSGKTTVDNGLTTASVGHPIIVAAVDSLANTALIASTPLLVNAPIGLYRIEPYIVSTTTCGTPGPAVVTLTLGWTDEGGAVTNSQITLSLGAIGRTSALGNNLSPLYVNSISNITYAVAYTACTSGTGTYNLRLRLIRE